MSGRAMPGLAVFLVASYGLALPLDAVLFHLGLSGALALPLLLARMATPLAGALAALYLERGGLHGVWEELGVRLPRGLKPLLAPSLAVLAGYTLGTLLTWEAVECGKCWVLREARIPVPLLALLAVLGGLVAGLTVNMLAALLEEAGWRGYLYPRLARATGSPLAGALLAGVIWGLWHAPLVWNGYNYTITLEGCEGDPARGPVAVAAFTLYTAALGLILAWARDKWRSTLPAAAAHGTVNGTAGFYTALCVSPRLLGPPAGLLVALGLLGVWAFITTLDRPWARAGQGRPG